MTYIFMRYSSLDLLDSCFWVPRSCEADTLSEHNESALFDRPPRRGRSCALCFGAFGVLANPELVSSITACLTACGEDPGNCGRRKRVPIVVIVLLVFLILAMFYLCLRHVCCKLQTNLMRLLQIASENVYKRCSHVKDVVT